ncbi:MAG: flagellin [Clostridiales Family XIII bacterium]|jgi:flagellin|nr:flagellin [Clostridiales Family XIII bacterium]
MIINHNVPALNTYRSLTINRENTNKSLAKLSSGLRINSAGDDAAGLAISEKMRSQIRGLDQATRNAQDGKSLLQVSEGALNETHSILQRMKELSVQSANDTNTQFDRTEIQKEIEQLKTEVDRISRDTEFNTMKLLNGTKGATATPDKSKNLNIAVVGTGLKDGNYTLQMKTGGGADVFGAENAQITATSSSNISLSGKIDATGAGTPGDIGLLAVTNDANGKPNGIGAQYGNYRLDASQNTSGSYDLTLHGPDGRYQVKSFETGHTAVKFDEIGIVFNFSGTNSVSGSGYYSFTLETKSGGGAPVLELTRPDSTKVSLTVDGYRGGNLNLGGLEFQGSIGLSTSGVNVRVQDNSLTLHIGANESQTMKVSVLDASTKALGVNLVDLTTQKNAETAVTLVDKAINRVSDERSKMGAIMNRLDHTIKNLGVSSENMTASESRIRDVDMAKEIMEFTKSNILSQASQSMLAQANAIPQGILSLLQ